MKFLEQLSTDVDIEHHSEQYSLKYYKPKKYWGRVGVEETAEESCQEVFQPFWLTLWIVITDTTLKSVILSYNFKIRQR